MVYCKITVISCNYILIQVFMLIKIYRMEGHFTYCCMYDCV